MAGARDREHCFFIQFAGQGVKYMEEIRRLYTQYPAMQPFIQDAIAEIKEQASQWDDERSNFFSQGLDVDRWIDHPDETPDLGYLQSSPLSHPMIYLCQISHYISIVQEGLDQEVLLRHSHSTTGFSTGVVAAILVSMGLPMDELFKMAIKVQAMFFWQGVRCQQSILQYGVRPKLIPELYDSPEGSPSCMASINGLDRKRLEEVIYEFADYGTVYPAYELLPERWIVSGLPEDLAEFNTYLKEHERETSWRYSPSTIAAHSPYLSYAFESTPQDAARIGLEFRGDEMKIPVRSNDLGTDLRTSQNIIEDVMRAYFAHTAVWRNQISPVLEPDTITHVLDFGPGTGVASLTESYIPESGIQVIPCALPIGRKRLFDEILPALDRA